MKQDKSLIDLLKLARSGKSEESRIIAGLSLYKIESDIGKYLLKSFRKSDDNEKVRRTFDRIYKKYISDKRSFNYDNSQSHQHKIIGGIKRSTFGVPFYLY